MGCSTRSAQGSGGRDGAVRRKRIDYDDARRDPLQAREASGDVPLLIEREYDGCQGVRHLEVLSRKCGAMRHPAV